MVFPVYYISFQIKQSFSTVFRYPLRFPWTYNVIPEFRSSLGKSVLKIYSKFTGKHPCRSVISIKLQSSFTEITLRHGCSPVNLLDILRTPFYKNIYGGLLLQVHRTFIWCLWCLRGVSWWTLISGHVA